MAVNQYVQDETRRYMQTNLLRDSVFLHEIRCRQLAYSRPQGTLILHSHRWDVHIDSEIFLSS
jgi:hypothetical protein